MSMLTTSGGVKIAARIAKQIIMMGRFSESHSTETILKRTSETKTKGSSKATPKLNKNIKTKFR